MNDVKRLRKEDYLTLFENAIVEKFGFEYNSDSARISWHDLDVIRKSVIANPYKFYYTEEAYENILNKLKEYVETQLSNYDLDGIEICEEDLVSILNTYNTGYDLEDSVHKQLEVICNVLNENTEERE